MKIFACCVIFLCWAATAFADILEWQDSNGVRHYTNLQSEVPKEQQHAVRVVVDELARQPTAPTQGAAAAEPAPRTEGAEDARQAQVVFDRSESARAYVAGLERGLELGQALNSGGSVGIRGPLAVSNATTVQPYSGYLAPAGYPLITTSFDRGRSRHLTLRMLLQDQFALDQEGPYIYEQRYLPPFGHPPLGVGLSPFLPRGLPHGVPPNLRVITR